MMLHILNLQHPQCLILVIANIYLWQQKYNILVALDIVILKLAPSLCKLVLKVVINCYIKTYAEYNELNNYW